jgi:hypothetical protein
VLAASQGKDDEARSLYAIAGMKMMMGNKMDAYEFLRRANSVDPKVKNWIRHDVIWNQNMSEGDLLKLFE